VGDKEQKSPEEMHSLHIKKNFFSSTSEDLLCCAEASGIYSGINHHGQQL